MTLPFYLRAGRKVVRDRCLNNVRQLGIAFRLFALDHEGHYPPSAVAAPIGPFPDGCGFAALAVYVKAGSVFYCPANRVFRLGPYALDSRYTGRRMAGYACWARYVGLPGSQMGGPVAGATTDPANTVLASDIIATLRGNPDVPHVYTSHREQVIYGGFVLYNDGHVRWREYRQTRRRLSGPGGLDWYF